MEHPKWIFNTDVLSHSAFRLYHYLLWVQRVNPHPVKGSAFIAFNRAHLCLSLGFAYNSVQDGIKELIRLGMVEIDPEGKANKNLLLLKNPDQFNREEIKMRISRSLLNRASGKAKTSNNDEDDENNFSLGRRGDD